MTFRSLARNRFIVMRSARSASSRARAPGPRRCPRAEHTGASKRADGDAMDGMVGRRGPSRRRDGADLRTRQPVGRRRRRRVRPRLLRSTRRRRPRDVDRRRARPRRARALASSARDAPTEEVLVRVYTPPHGHTAVDVVLDDMPFVVDSLTMALDRRNLGVHLVVHPILRVRRSNDGKLLRHRGRRRDPARRPGEQILLESWTHIEIDRETSTEILDSVRTELLAVLARRAGRDPRLAADARGRAPGRRPSSSEMPPPCADDELAEGKALLQWLADQHFTFLGYREYGLAVRRAARCPVPGSGLGLLRDAPEEPSASFAALPAGRPREGAREDPARADEGERALDRAPPDAPRLRGDQALRRGTARWSASTASSACTRRARTRRARSTCPVLRRKVAAVIERAGFLPASHDQKDLIRILETYPRDDLFQIDVDHLFENAMGILRLQERRRVRLFVHREPYGRFVSCLVFIPRDRYTTQVREQIAHLLVDAYGSKGYEWNTRLSESVLARLHYVLHLDDRATTSRSTSPSWSNWSRRRPARGSTTCATRSIASRGEETGLDALRVWSDAFPGAYQDDFGAGEALADLAAARTARRDHPARGAAHDRGRPPRPQALRHRRAAVALGGAAAPVAHGRDRRRRAPVRVDAAGHRHPLDEVVPPARAGGHDHRPGGAARSSRRRSSR